MLTTTLCSSSPSKTWAFDLKGCRELWGSWALRFGANASRQGNLTGSKRRRTIDSWSHGKFQQMVPHHFFLLQQCTSRRRSKLSSPRATQMCIDSVQLIRNPYAEKCTFLFNTPCSSYPQSTPRECKWLQHGTLLSRHGNEEAHQAVDGTCRLETIHL